MMSKNLKSLLLLGVFCSAAHAQFLVELSADVTESEGIYTYTYTLENSLFSFQNVNTFLLTTGKGAVVTEISGPNGWVGDYASQDFNLQAAFLAGDGFSCGDSLASEIQPGQTETFVIESTWAPEDQDYNLGRLKADCDWEGAPLAGMIASPSIAPEVPLFDPCDFDQDGDCDLRDINNLASTIALGDHDPTYELTGDDLVDTSDLDAFLEQTNRINGDADFNGKVEFADFLTLSGNFGQDNAFWSDGDFAPDGEVGFSDFLILSGNFGQGEVVAASVPEPATHRLLGALIAPAFILRSRRRRESSR